MLFVFTFLFEHFLYIGNFIEVKIKDISYVLVYLDKFVSIVTELIHCPNIPDYALDKFANQCNPIAIPSAVYCSTALSIALSAKLIGTILPFSSCL